MSQRHHAITLPDGTIIFALTGADGEDEGQQDGGDDDDAQQGAGEDDDEDGEEEVEDSVESLRVKLKTAEDSSADLKRRLRAADRTAHRYRTENEELKAKSAKPAPKPKEDDAVSTELQELRDKLAAKEASDKRAEVLEAFTNSDKYEWQNRKVAFGLLDVEDVQDSKGRVDQQALDDAMAEIAKQHPYLLKDGKGKPKDDDRPKPERPSGQQPGSHRRDRNKPDVTKLAQKYPQLAGRN